ncbi:MAG: MFS transporter, partial [Hyphomicrobiaceae bacterium]|nr:MFS transporter [Hyphomicrobiaceae bacterium]
MTMPDARPSSAAAGGLPLWAIIGAAGVITGVTVGLRQVVGLYMPPLTQSLGTGVGPFSTAMAVANLVWGVAGVVAGGLADRYGAGRITAAGIALLMLGYYVMFAAQSGDDLLWSGIAIGTGVGAAGLSVLVGVVGRAAPPEKRTVAIATLGMASGIGNFV